MSLSCQLTTVMNVVGHGNDGVVLVILLWGDVLRMRGASVASRFYRAENTKNTIRAQIDHPTTDCTVIVLRRSDLQRFVANACDNWGHFGSELLFRFCFALVARHAHLARKNVLVVV